MQYLRDGKFITILDSLCSVLLTVCIELRCLGSFYIRNRDLVLFSE